MNPEQIRLFEQNGYLLIPDFNPRDQIEIVTNRFESLFRGEFETGLQPDEWNWREGVSPPDLTRQICNGWKSDTAIAKLVTNEKVGEICALLMNWPGARINQDNVIWKPGGSKPLGFHQDDSYQNWIEPSSMISCWMALDDTRKHGGTIEYARGSHRWPVQTKTFTFHGPSDYHEGLKYSANQLGIDTYTIDQLEVKKGDVVFHHGRIWHGSEANQLDIPRRSVVSHCMSSEAQFHPENKSPIYNRYKKFDSLLMDESFFPITYSRKGYRSPFLDEI